MSFHLLFLKAIDLQPTVWSDEMYVSNLLPLFALKSLMNSSITPTFISSKVGPYNLSGIDELIDPKIHEERQKLRESSNTTTNNADGGSSVLSAGGPTANNKKKPRAISSLAFLLAHSSTSCFCQTISLGSLFTLEQETFEKIIALVSYSVQKISLTYCFTEEEDKTNIKNRKPFLSCLGTCSQLRHLRFDIDEYCEPFARCCSSKEMIEKVNLVECLSPIAHNLESVSVHFKRAPASSAPAASMPYFLGEMWNDFFTKMTAARKLRYLNKIVSHEDGISLEKLTSSLVFPTADGTTTNHQESNNNDENNNNSKKNTALTELHLTSAATFTIDQFVTIFQKMNTNFVNLRKLHLIYSDWKKSCFDDFVERAVPCLPISLENIFIKAVDRSGEYPSTFLVNLSERFKTGNLREFKLETGMFSYDALDIFSKNLAHSLQVLDFKFTMRKVDPGETDEFKKTHTLLPLVQLRNLEKLVIDDYALGKETFDGYFTNFDGDNNDHPLKNSQFENLKVIEFAQNVDGTCFDARFPKLESLYLKVRFNRAFFKNFAESAWSRRLKYLRVDCIDEAAEEPEDLVNLGIGCANVEELHLGGVGFYEDTKHLSFLIPARKLRSIKADWYVPHGMLWSFLDENWKKTE